MNKLSLSELQRRIEEAKTNIPPGSKWQHYKGNMYVVSDIVVIEATLELAIVYRSLDNPLVPFLRPLVVWQDVMEYEGEKLYRFRRIG